MTDIYGIFTMFGIMTTTCFICFILVLCNVNDEN